LNVQRNIAIIPARAGSKRLKGKNNLEFRGKPLIQHSIDYAMANESLIHELFVSTDDSSIKAIALANNIGIIDRPKTLAGDSTPTVDVIKHALGHIDEDVDNVILLQITNPLRPKNLLTNAFRKYIEGHHDSLMTVTRNHQKFGKIIDGKFQPFNYRMGQRSQDLEPLYFENGMLYITKAEMIKQGRILGDNNYPFIVDHPFAHIDIDTQYDLEMADFIAEYVENTQIENE
jgi:N-acylneuraminate cytidylyltransferase